MRITMVPRDEAAKLIGLITADGSNDPQFRMGFRVAIEAAVGCISAMPAPGRTLESLWRVRFNRAGAGDAIEVYLTAPTINAAFTKITEAVREAWAEQGEEPAARQLETIDDISLVARDVEVIR